MSSKKISTISIIVPVYNVEKYLSRCVDSILNQTFTDFELILVDDGSTDKSGDICDEYKSKDNRVKVIHKSNEGVSVARNIGLDISTGEYIGFIDSDDYVELDMLRKIINLAKEKDCYVLEYAYKILEDNEVVDDKINNLKVEVIENNVEFAIERVIDNPFCNVVWNKIYKRDIVKDIRFNRNFNICEDVEYTYKAILNSNKYVITNEKMYFYNQRENSLCRNEEYSLEKVRSSLECQKSRLDALKSYKINNKIIFKAEERLCNDIFRHYVLAKRIKDKNESKVILNYLKDLFKEKKSMFLSNDILRKKRFMIRIFSISEYLYYFIYSLIKAIKYLREGIRVRLLNQL